VSRPLLVDIRTGRTLPKAALLIGALILLVLKAGYAMQPPPPPLDLARFKELISLADLILVGEIGEVRETEKAAHGETHGAVEADLRVEELLKGKVRGDRIEGTHAYEPLGSGSYDRHLCEFVIENDGIKARYFKFAEDLSHYAGSETDFVRLIKQLQDQDS
jgi:hypothetical protein